MNKKIILFLSLSLLLTSVVYASPIDNNNKDNFREVKSTIIDNEADMEELKEEGVVFRSPKTTRPKEDVDVLTDEEYEYKEVRSIIIDNKDDMEKLKEEDIVFRQPNKDKPNNISLLTDEVIATFNNVIDDETWWIIDNLPRNRSYYIRFSSPLGSSISGEGYIA